MEKEGKDEGGSLDARERGAGCNNAQGQCERCKMTQSDTSEASETRSRLLPGIPGLAEKVRNGM